MYQYCTLLNKYNTVHEEIKHIQQFKEEYQGLFQSLHQSFQEFPCWKSEKGKTHRLQYNS